MPLFERSGSFFRWNDISYETTEKTASFRAKKNRNRKKWSLIIMHHGPFKCLQRVYLENTWHVCLRFLSENFNVSFTREREREVFILKSQHKQKQHNKWNKINARLQKLIQQYEGAVKGREVFESNGYLSIANMSRMKLTFFISCMSINIFLVFGYLKKNFSTLVMI